MERGLPGTGLNGSALVGGLVRLGWAEGPPTRPDVALGLGRWLGWADAIALAAALQPPPKVLERPDDDAGRAERELARVRAALVRAIEADGAEAPGAPRGRRSSAAAGATVDDPDLAEGRRRHAALQQAMAAAIGPLRAQARATLARRSPAMRRLADLDAVMERVLGAREQALLAALPSRLARHAERGLRADDGPTFTVGGVPPATPPRGDAPSGFRAQRQRLLLAELELRLLPVQGLIDALRDAHERGFHE